MIKIDVRSCRKAIKKCYELGGYDFAHSAAKDILRVITFEAMNNGDFGIINNDFEKLFIMMDKELSIMKNAKEIYKETSIQAHNDNCQSVNVIGTLAVKNGQNALLEHLNKLAIETKNDDIIKFIESCELELTK